MRPSGHGPMIVHMTEPQVHENPVTGQDAGADDFVADLAPPPQPQPQPAHPTRQRRIFD